MKTKESLYKVFYISKGKYFLTPSWLTDGPKESITKKHPTFKEEVGWFTFKQAQKIIKEQRFTTTWGICDENGKQVIAEKFSRILKNPGQNEIQTNQ